VIHWWPKQKQKIQIVPGAIQQRHGNLEKSYVETLSVKNNDINVKNALMRLQ
jgi:hypothetical protein